MTKNIEQKSVLHLNGWIMQKTKEVWKPPIWILWNFSQKYSILIFAWFHIHYQGGQDVPIGTQKSGWEHVVPGRNHPTTSHISSVTGSQNTGQKFGQPSIGSTAGMQDLMYAGQSASLPREFIKGYCQLIGCGSIYGTRTKSVPLKTVSVTNFLYFNLTQKQFLQTMLVMYGFHLEKRFFAKILYEKPCNFELFIYLINCVFLRREHK